MAIAAKRNQSNVAELATGLKAARLEAAGPEHHYRLVGHVLPIAALTLLGRAGSAFSDPESPRVAP